MPRETSHMLNLTQSYRLKLYGQISRNLFCTHTVLVSKMTEKGMAFDGHGNVLQDQSACAGVRADLKMCLLQSDCVKKGKKTPRQCLIVDDGSVPMHCQALRNLFFECKRSMLDQRQRFRGRKGY